MTLAFAGAKSPLSFHPRRFLVGSLDVDDWLDKQSTDGAVVATITTFGCKAALAPSCPDTPDSWFHRQLTSTCNPGPGPTGPVRRRPHRAANAGSRPIPGAANGHHTTGQCGKEPMVNRYLCNHNHHPSQGRELSLRLAMNFAFAIDAAKNSPSSMIFSGAAASI